jgi:hypothetical protein
MSRKLAVKILKPLAPVRAITKPLHSLYVKSPHLEHGGFVALAASEVFHLGPVFFTINVFLLIVGAMAIAYETFHLFGE